MRFLVDAQLPRILSRHLIRAGHLADHVDEAGLAGASDRKIWSRAYSTGAVIVTKDEDFARRRIAATTGPAVLWIRLGNTRKQALLDRVGTSLPQVLDAFARGETLVEITSEP